MSRMPRSVTAAWLIIGGAPAISLAQYRITHTYPLGGDGSWDYVVPDARHHRLFIGRQNRVMVVTSMKSRVTVSAACHHGHGAPD